MRSWLAILLLVLLPLQLSWAAMGRYCEHARFEHAQLLTQHWGHHAHQHWDAVMPEQEADQANGLVDMDCGTGHSNGSMATPAQDTSSAIKPAAVFADVPAFSLTSVPVNRPERPQWYVLA